VRRWWRMALGVVVLALLAAVLWFTPTNDYVILPGVTGNLSRMVQVAGGHAPRRGRLLMVAVDLAPANLLMDLYARVSPYAELVPGAELVPQGASLSQYLQESALEMDQSHLDAEVAALRYLGYPAKVTGQGAVVLATVAHTPAAARLKPGDVIVQMNEQPVRTANGLVQAMARVRVGSRVRLVVRRHGHLLSFLLRTVPNPQARDHAMVGVGIGTYHQRYVIPVRIHIRSGDITGPSAGLMFGLAIVDELRPSLDLTHGLVVAGTGEIDAAGNVQEIGGVREKVVTVYNAGAKVFLVPAPNYASALAEEERIGIAGKLRLIPVRTLAEAVSALAHLPRG
jgi:PDZ domain-containing protein